MKSRSSHTSCLALIVVVVVLLVVVSLVVQAVAFLFAHTLVVYGLLLLAAGGVWSYGARKQRMARRRRAAERKVLAVEEARSGPERRLLLAQEFSRLCEDALRARPGERATWLPERDLDLLRHQTRLLAASVSDRLVDFLPENGADASLSAPLLARAIAALDSYTGMLQQARTGTAPAGEQLRIMLRERNRLQTMYDTVVQGIEAR